MAHGRLSTLLPEIRSSGRDLSDDPFDLPHKSASVDRLRRWRQAALELNSSRRFRYTQYLKNEEAKEREMIQRKIRAHAQVIRAAFPLEEVGERSLRVMDGAFPSDVPAPAPMLVPGAGLLGLFVSASPEVAMQMLRDQGGPPPFELTFGRRARKAGRGGGLPMGHPEPRKIRRGRAYRRWGF